MNKQSYKFINIAAFLCLEFAKWEVFSASQIFGISNSTFRILVGIPNTQQKVKLLKYRSFASANILYFFAIVTLQHNSIKDLYAKYNVVNSIQPIVTSNTLKEITYSRFKCVVPCFTTVSPKKLL